MEIGADSWAVRFSYWQSRVNKYTVFPAITRIQHIGWDGSGVHGTYVGPLDTHIKAYVVNFELKNVKVDPEIISMLKSIYSGNLSSRIAKYLRNNGFEQTEIFIRRLLGK